MSERKNTFYFATEDLFYGSVADCEEGLTEYAEKELKCDTERAKVLVERTILSAIIFEDRYDAKSQSLDGWLLRMLWRELRLMQQEDRQVQNARQKV
ncbi:MAG: hypothetical protein JO026_00260 [Patescibacteria group bacterium]|nr:hypothetical protein [Patescibacteria group bacterium]